MVIDIFVLLALAMAILKGYRLGLIVALLQFVGVIIAAAAALKLGTYAAVYLHDNFGVNNRYAPMLGFILIFMLFAIGIRLLAAMLTKTAKFAMVGWLNSLGGVIFYVLLQLVIISILLFYITKTHLLPQEQINTSQAYPILVPFAPAIMEGIGKLLPIFSNLFKEAESFFEQVAPASKGNVS